MSYWHLPEDLLYGILGNEPVGRKYVKLPYGVAVTDENKRIYFEILEDYIPELESMVEIVLDVMQARAERALDKFLIKQGEDPEDYDHNLWYKNIPEELAWETLIGLGGGGPHYTYVRLDYIPTMLEDLGVSADMEDTFDNMVDPVIEVGKEEWRNWVEPVVLAAFKEVAETFAK